jgi:hypothetical protein
VTAGASQYSKIAELRRIGHIFLSPQGTHLMSDLKSDSLDPSQQRQMALSTWDNEGGAGPRSPQERLISGEVKSEVPELTNAELVQLRIRVIALDALVWLNETAKLGSRELLFNDMLSIELNGRIAPPSSNVTRR